MFEKGVNQLFTPFFSKANTIMTKEEIKNLKKEHDTAGINELPFEDGQSVFFKVPNRREFKLIMSKGTQGAAALAESFVKNCLVAGDVGVKDICSDKDTRYMGEVMASIDDLLNTKKATIKKH